jgi:hypothetical protein
VEASHSVQVRLALLKLGHVPLPCNGKRPTISGWQECAVTEDDIRHWGDGNTGVRTEFTPGLDCDVGDPEVSEALLQEVKDWHDTKAVLARYGRSPRWLVPFWTDAPFTKMSRSFVSPNGETHKLEFLGRGQQFISEGEHPETHQPYLWVGNLALHHVERDELPYITESEAQKLIDHLSDVVCEEYGWRVKGDVEVGHEKVNVDSKLEPATQRRTSQ